MRQLRYCIGSLIVAACLQAPAFSQGLDYFDTADMRMLYFSPGESYLVPYAARSFENSLQSQRQIFDYQPWDRVSVLLLDFADHGNAGAYPVPRNQVTVDIAPRPPTFETTAPAERMRSWMKHELVHLVTTDQPNSNDIRARNFFRGKIRAESAHPETILYSYLTNPRLFAPRWYQEGIAVFVETWLAGGLGRAQGAFDEMVFRSKVRDGSHIYDPLGLVAEGTKVDFQVGVNAYLYGTRFMTWVAVEYDPERLVQWVTRQEGSHRSYEEEFERIFGISLNEAWQNWIDFERQFQQDNLQSIRQYPVSEYQNITRRGLGSVSRGFIDEQSGTLYAGFRYQGTVAHVGALSLADGNTRRLQDIKGPMLYRVTSLAHDPDSRRLFYTADNYAYRDIMSIDLATGEQEMLLKDSRIGELVFNRKDRSLWGVRHLHGLASLVQIPYPYTEWNLVRTFDYGVSLFDLDISPDGELLSGSTGDVTGQQKFQIFRIDELQDEAAAPLHEFDFGQAVPEGFVFSADGRYLYGSSYYTGVSNIWRYDTQTEALDIVSNSDTGFFRPIPRADGSLLMFHYTGDGFLPATLQPEPLQDVNSINFLGAEAMRRHPQLADWEAASPTEIDLDALSKGEGQYVPIKNLSLESWYPILEGYKDSVAAGVNFNFSDPILFDTLEVSASYSPDSDLPSDERLHLSIDYSHVVASATPLAGTWHAGARYNFADFYDLFGPTKQSLKGNWFYVGYDKTLLYDEPRQLNFRTELNHYANLDRLPRYQNIDTVFDKLTTFEVDLNYSHVKKSLGAVDDEKGFKWRLIGAADYVNSDTIPKFFGNFDFGLPLWWSHSSIWFRNSAGLAVGDELDEFANFFFGGYGNNYVDSGKIKRYRNEYAMPGFEINEIFGRNFARSMIEINLPPIRFSRVGTPGFYLSWARPALFATALVTNLDGSTLRQDTYNVGAQVDFQFTILSNMDMTLSVGYAVANGRRTEQSDEFMISLKIL